MRLFLISCGAGFGAFLALLLIVFATGQTFGQRCERLHPDGSAAELERCVTQLSDGERDSD